MFILAKFNTFSRSLTDFEIQYFFNTYYRVGTLTQCVCSESIWQYDVELHSCHVYYII